MTVATTVPLNFPISKLLSILPGNKKLTMVVNSMFPAQIIEQLKTRNYQNYDCILLTQVDVWRYRNDFDLLNFFNSNKSQQFFVQTVGFENKKLTENATELCYNILYGDRQKINVDLKTKDTRLGYASLNNRSAYHRARLGVKLFENNLLDQVMFSLGNNAELSEYLTERLADSPGWSQFTAMLPIKVPGLLWESDQGRGVSHPAFQDAFAYISTETETESIDQLKQFATPTATEKTWKPFLTCQIPVYLAAPGHLKFVKDLGFETFDWLFPDDFDYGSTEYKVDCIVDLVAKGRSYIEQIYFENTDKILYNWELATSDKVEQIMLDQARNFVYNRNTATVVK